jgi:ribonuclease T2
VTTTRKATAILMALVLATAAGTSQARRHHHHERDQASEGASQRGAAGSFDYYVLSLSWAPSFCATHPGNSDECASPHGFVLHGLWPQYAAGGYPDTCSGRLLNPQELQAAAAVYPATRLAAHEWAKHGTCSGLDPLAYFKAAAAARDSIRVPPQLQPGPHTATLRAADIVTALRKANPQLPSRAIVVTCGQRALAELRVCLDKNLAPRECGPDVRPSCGGGPVSVPGAQ